MFYNLFFGLEKLEKNVLLVHLLQAIDIRKSNLNNLENQQAYKLIFNVVLVHTV